MALYQKQRPGLPLRSTANLEALAQAVYDLKQAVPGTGTESTFDGDMSVQGSLAIGGGQPWFDVTHPIFGADATGVADSTTAIQTAINAVPATGGVVYFPVGVYKITAPVVVDSSYVALIGAVRAGDLDQSATGSGVTLKWFGSNGGGPMIDVQPPTTSDLILRSVRIENMSLNASSGTGLIAATGLNLINVCVSRFVHLEIRQASTVAVDMTSKNVPSGPKGVFNCLFDDVVVRQDSALGGTPIGFRLDGVDNNGNANHNRFQGCKVHYYNGTGYKLLNADTNWFFGCISHRLSGGSGTSVEFNGSNTTGLHARRNAFFGFSQEWDASSSYGAPIARGTGLTFPSTANVMFDYTQGNANPLPTIEPGATLYYQTDDGLSTMASLALSSAQARAIDVQGTYTSPGIDFNSGTFNTGCIRLKNNSTVTSRNNAGSADIELFRLNTSDELSIPAATRHTGTVTIGGGTNVVLSGTTGTKIGTATSQLLAFHNSTPVAQRAGAAQAAVATTASTQTTPFGFTTAAQADAIITLLNEIRATLVEKGLMKGAA